MCNQSPVTQAQARSCTHGGRTEAYVWRSNVAPVARRRGGGWVHATPAPCLRRTCDAQWLCGEHLIYTNSTRTVHFGATGASDYPQHRDPVRKQRYLARHAPREDWDNPMTAGALSRWILWNKETLYSSAHDYARRFGISLA